MITTLGIRGHEALCPLTPRVFNCSARCVHNLKFNNTHVRVAPCACILLPRQSENLRSSSNNLTDVAGVWRLNSAGITANSRVKFLVRIIPVDAARERRVSRATRRRSFRSRENAKTMREGRKELRSRRLLFQLWPIRALSFYVVAKYPRIGRIVGK